MPKNGLSDTQWRTTKDEDGRNKTNLAATRTSEVYRITLKHQQQQKPSKIERERERRRSDYTATIKHRRTWSVNYCWEKM